MPLVSIIIPCHNAAPWLASTLESALGPGWPWLAIAAPCVFAGSRACRPVAALHAGAFPGAGLLSFVISDAARTLGIRLTAALLTAAWMARVSSEGAERWLQVVCMPQIVTPAI